MIRQQGQPIPPPPVPDQNLRITYFNGTTVGLEPVNGNFPALIPLVNASGKYRMASLSGTLQISTGTIGPGGLEAALTPDTGYNVYVLAQDSNPAVLVGFAAPDDGTPPVFPAGYGSFHSDILRYFCCNEDDGGGNYTQILPFTETDTREIWYHGTNPGQTILQNNNTIPLMVVPLKASLANRKGQLPSSARKVFLNVEATDLAVTGGLALYTDSAQTVNWHGFIGSQANSVQMKTAPITVPCRGAVQMNTTALAKEWFGTAGPVVVSVYALGFQL